MTPPQFGRASRTTKGVPRPRLTDMPESREVEKGRMDREATSGASLSGPCRPRPVRPPRRNWRPLASSLVVLVGVASIGLIDSRSEACGGCPMDLRIVRAFTNDDGKVDDASRDPGDSGIDPGYEKAVATCHAAIVAADKVRVTIANGYPSYTCTLWVKVLNGGKKDVRSKSVRITAPDELDVRVSQSPACKTIRAGKWAWWSFTVHVEQAAAYHTGYSFTVKLNFEGKEGKGGGCG